MVAALMRARAAVLLAVLLCAAASGGCGSDGARGDYVKALNKAQTGLAQSEPGSQLVDRLCKAAVTGERVALRPDDSHGQEMTIVTAQPRQQTGAQERRLAHS